MGNGVEWVGSSGVEWSGLGGGGKWIGVEFHFSLIATRDWKSESVTD